MSPVRAQEKSGVSEDRKDNMGTDNPYTIDRMSGFRSAPQKLSLEHSFRLRFSSSWRQTLVGPLFKLCCQNQYFRSHIVHGRVPEVCRLIVFRIRPVQ